MTCLGAHTASCSCAGDDELPVNPFLALRATYGMLLGEDDFHVLAGNPRGKQMLATSWLHGPGVVWGLGVAASGDDLAVGPGLAVDGWGRELLLETSHCLSLAAWAADWARDHPPDGSGKRTAHAWVVAEFASCPDRPVPALADPCDVTRAHDDYSRVVESVRLRLRGAHHRPRHPYHRIRVLLGLAPGGDGEAEKEARHAAQEVAKAPPDQRPAVLLHWFRVLAARDSMEAEPGWLPGDACLPLFPVTEEDAAVVLAHVSVPVTEDAGSVRVGTATVDPSARAVLLPTATIQELVCGLAPGLLGAGTRPDEGGPRLIRDSIDWSRGNTRLTFVVTRPLADGSQESAIEISSLSARGRGWSAGNVERVRLEDGGRRVVVDLDDSPAYETVRLVIRGTGPTPFFGRDPRVPFAGLEGGPPGTRDDGHDAVITMRLDDPDLAGAGPEAELEPGDGAGRAGA